MFQSLIEFNWKAPPQLLTFSERLKYFEAFWDSDVLHIGEKDAMGFEKWYVQFLRDRLPSRYHDRHYTANEFANKNNKHSIWSKDGDHCIPKNLPSGISNRWLRRWVLNEEKESMLNWFPYPEEPPEDEDEDLNRFILFDDIKMFLFETTDLTIKQKMIIQFLDCMGISNDILDFGLKCDEVKTQPSSIELFETMHDIYTVVNPYANKEVTQVLLKQQYKEANIDGTNDALQWLQENVSDRNTPVKNRRDQI
eukprot:UN24487